MPTFSVWNVDDLACVHVDPALVAIGVPLQNVLQNETKQVDLKQTTYGTFPKTYLFAVDELVVEEEEGDVYRPHSRCDPYGFALVN